MRYLSFLLLSVLFLIACGEKPQVELISKYPNGTPQKLQHVVWEKNKKLVVKEIRLFPNGEKEVEGEIKNGKRHGKWTYWHDNGKVWLEEFYKNGVKHGKMTEWYKSGEKNYEANFKNGIPDGKWIFWDGKGSKLKTMEYENGKQISR